MIEVEWPILLYLVSSLRRRFWCIYESKQRVVSMVAAFLHGPCFSFSLQVWPESCKLKYTLCFPSCFWSWRFIIAIETLTEIVIMQRLDYSNPLLKTPYLSHKTLENHVCTVLEDSFLFDSFYKSRRLCECYWRRKIIISLIQMKTLWVTIMTVLARYVHWCYNAMNSLNKFKTGSTKWNPNLS